MNNRLDYVKNFKNKEKANQMLQDCRNEYIKLDEGLYLLANQTTDTTTLRALSLARTQLECSLFYAQKGIALFHEKKPFSKD